MIELQPSIAARLWRAHRQSEHTSGLNGALRTRLSCHQASKLCSLAIGCEERYLSEPIRGVVALMRVRESRKGSCG